MIRKAETLAMTVLLVGLSCTPGLGQAPPATILVIDTENQVQYFGDVSDPSKLATDPNVTTAVVPRNFEEFLIIGDIVAVNGQPAKGAMLANARQFALRANPNPGEAIADGVDRNSTFQQTFEILGTAGVNAPIGSIFVSGLRGGPSFPGAPLGLEGWNAAIIGGTGAFLGARGQAGQGVHPQPLPVRQASIAEDPAKRRLHGGGRVRWVLHVIPMNRPEVVITASGPAVTHSNDFALVSTARPAAPGEILSLFATGLGPTGTGFGGPGLPFPASPLRRVSSPVEVAVNGRPAEVLAAVGFPGTEDGYQVNFRIPSDTPRGTATVRVTNAWIAGAAVNITIQ